MSHLQGSGWYPARWTGFYWRWVVAHFFVLGWELWVKIQNLRKGVFCEPMLTTRTLSYSQDAPLNSRCEPMFTRYTPVIPLVSHVFMKRTSSCRLDLQNKSANFELGSRVKLILQWHSMVACLPLDKLYIIARSHFDSPFIFPSFVSNFLWNLDE